VQKQNKKRHAVVFDLLCCLLDIIAFQSHADRRQSINMSLKRKCITCLARYSLIVLKVPFKPHQSRIKIIMAKTLVLSSHFNWNTV